MMKLHSKWSHTSLRGAVSVLYYNSVADAMKAYTFEWSGFSEKRLKELEDLINEDFESERYPDIYLYRRGIKIETYKERAHLVGVDHE